MNPDVESVLAHMRIPIFATGAGRRFIDVNYGERFAERNNAGQPIKYDGSEFKIFQSNSFQYQTRTPAIKEVC